MKMELKPFEQKLWMISPTMHGEELEYIKDAFDKNWVTTIGENINEVERQISEYIGCRYAVALSAGTTALHMAVKLAGIGQGDKVLCTDMTFAASVNPIVYEKGIPVFVDSEYESLNMDPAALERAFALHPDVKAAMVVDLYGTPARYDEIKAICDEHGVPIIEDAAEAMGAKFKGVRTGSFGRYNCLSFNGNKIITGSSGGMFLTDSKEDADRVRKWSTQSREAAPWYQHEELGYNYRMSNIIAGVVRGQFLHMQEHLDRKKEVYQRYVEGFKGLPVQMNPYVPETMAPSFWIDCMLIDRDAMCSQERGDKQARYVSEHGKSCPTEILEALTKYNAEGRPIWKPMHMQPIFSAYPYVSAVDGVNVGEDIFARGLCLPSDIKMTAEQQEIVIEIIRECFD